jgi:hypothetical protein
VVFIYFFDAGFPSDGFFARCSSVHWSAFRRHLGIHGKTNEKKPFQLRIRFRHRLPDKKSLQRLRPQEIIFPGVFSGMPVAGQNPELSGDHRVLYETVLTPGFSRPSDGHR